MVETVLVDLADNWIEVSDGLANVCVSTESVHGFYVHVGAAAPAGALAETGRVFGDAEKPVSLSWLGTGDKVFARAVSEALKVSVMRG